MGGEFDLEAPTFLILLVSLIFHCLRTAKKHQTEMEGHILHRSFTEQMVTGDTTDSLTHSLHHHSKLYFCFFISFFPLSLSLSLSFRSLKKFKNSKSLSL